MKGFSFKQGFGILMHMVIKASNKILFNKFLQLFYFRSNVLNKIFESHLY